MQFFYGGANTLERLGLGLNQEQPFRGGFNLLLPAIDRFDLWHDVDAGASRRSTRALAIFLASSCEPAVVMTIRALVIRNLKSEISNQKSQIESTNWA